MDNKLIHKIPFKNGKSKAAILTLLMLFSLALPLTLIPVASAAATITLSPTSGVDGTIVTVTGSGFAAIQVLTPTFAGLTTAWLTGGTTDLNGVIMTGTTTPGATFFVPANTGAGTYSVIVSDPAGNRASATFTVTAPSITISPTSGPFGTTIVVSGSGFLPSNPVGGANLPTLATPTNTIGVQFGRTTAGVLIPAPAVTAANVGLDGKIYATFVPTTAIPYTTTYPTSAIVVVTDALGNTITTTYTLARPTLTLSGPTAGTITATGAGFRAGATINFAYGSAYTAIATTATSNGTGAFTARLSAPSPLPTGAVTIYATDSGSFVTLGTNVASATVNIAASMSVTMGTATGTLGAVATTFQWPNTVANPVPGAAGGLTTGYNLTGTYIPMGLTNAGVEIVLSGFAASSAVSFTWLTSGGATVVNPPSVTTDPQGSARQVVAEGAGFSAAGNYVLVATDAAGTTVQSTITALTATAFIIPGTSGMTGGNVNSYTYFGAPGVVAGTITIGTLTYTGPASVATTWPVGVKVGVLSSTVGTAPYALTATGVVGGTAIVPATYTVVLGGGFSTLTDVPLPGTFTVTAAAPSVTVSPTTGTRGTGPISLTATGFLNTITSVAGLVTFGGLTLTPVSTAISSGTLRTTFTVPSYPPGTYTVAVSDGTNTASASFTITSPTATLSTASLLSTIPSATTPNTVRFNVTNFAPTSALTVAIVTPATAIVIDPASPMSTVPVATRIVTTDAAGAAYGIFQTTQTLVAGSKVLTITDATGNTVTASVTIVAAIALTPPSAPQGNTIQLEANGFATLSVLSLAFNTTTPTYMQLLTGTTAGATTSATGAIALTTVTFVLPTTLAGGVYTVTVSDAATPNNTATTVFAVTSPAFTMTPAQGAVGTTVTVNGTGFLPSGTTTYTTTITFGSVIPAGWISAGRITTTTGAATSTNPAGSIGYSAALTFVVPTLTAGVYTVTISDTMETATANFTITTAAITLNQTRGSPGDTINITGTGFNPTVGIIAGGIYLPAPPAIPVALTLGGTLVPAVFAAATGGVLDTVSAVNGTGVITSTLNGAATDGLQFVIPPTTTAGTYTVVLSFPAAGAVPATSASAIFTVQPTLVLAPTVGVVKGTLMTINGMGFAAGSSLLATLGGQTIVIVNGVGNPVIATGTGATAGQFASFYTLPVTTPTGANTLVVRDGAGNTATTTITVTVPTLTLGAATVAPGASLQVTGSGYLAVGLLTAAVQYVVTFDGSVQTTSPATLASITGSIVGFFTVPNTATAGVHVVTLTDSSGNAASTNVTVSAGSTAAPVDTTTFSNSAATVNPATGAPQTSFARGTSLKISFTLQTTSGSANTVWRITFQQPDLSVFTITSTTASMSTSPATLSFTTLLPANVQAGTWSATVQIFASDGATPLAVKTLAFIVS